MIFSDVAQYWFTHRSTRVILLMFDIANKVAIKLSGKPMPK